MDNEFTEFRQHPLPQPTQQQIDYVDYLNNNKSEMQRVVNEYQNQGGNPGYYQDFRTLPNPLVLYNYTDKWSIIIVGQSITGPFTTYLVWIPNGNIFQPNTTQPPYPFYTYNAFLFPTLQFRYLFEFNTWYIS
ncbi:hypothetical protein [Peribacillus sp. ACCC06369]|uniref:hypothetical protein n=1 Tax=Peribacillus sp. ACCC06369 TaxID=3055860 RepID=UPI0025A26FE6|nr:hypothetical protein [Peribacillus sp. ACCC06369]MDM5361180.1 hypothetical protein [Peribacillus sp. ACCC06369]